MKLDVAVLGGGMAGGLLARQLLREIPGLRLGIFERSTERAYKVGESTVEIASNHLIRRLGLSRYLYEHHLPKNGLRYFFDDERRAAALCEMSEIGTINLPFHPAFQVDRARLDADLLEMNAHAGARVHAPAQVVAIELGSGGARHRLRVEAAGSEQAVECRWLLDASGRAGLVPRALGLRVREEAHPIRAVWGRFEGVADVDDLGLPGFGDRVRHTSRGLSTIHFCYPGYWIWFIPLRGGLTSIGFVGHPPGDSASLRSVEGFSAFLREHRAVASLLREAKAVDVAHYKNLSFGTRRFFSADRWGLCGESASFADPLYSPGADFIALEADFLTDLVRRDLEGVPEAELARRSELYDGFMVFRHEAAMRLYRGLYGGLGSFELMRMKWDFDIGCYYNLWVSPYMRDEHLEEGFLRRQLRQQRFVLQALSNYAELFQRVESHLRDAGDYYRSNLGQFSFGLENIDFVERVGLARPGREVLGKTAEIFNGVRWRALELLDRRGEVDRTQPLPLTSLMVERSLV